MPTFNKCALCTQLLSDKYKSKEHIIPNAIGGRKKTTGFICKTCNSKYGDQWDSELAKQMNWFSSTMGIDRDRGETPPQIVQTVEGDKYFLLNDGSLTPEKSSHLEEDIEGGVKIRMVAKTMNEAKQRLKGIAKKYPTIDVEKILSELKIETEYLESPLHMVLSLHGANVGRSFVKTAFAFASESGVQHNECDKALEYLLNEDTKSIPYGYSYLSDIVENRPQSNIFHCVSLHGDPKKKKLWSYIEYFGLFRVVVLLSDKYNGAYKNEIYSVNPIDGSCANVRLKSNISEEEFSLIINGFGYNSEKHKEAAEYVIAIIMKRIDSRNFERTFKEGFDYAAKMLGIKEGEIIPREKAWEFTSLMMEKIKPYVENLTRNRR